MEARRRCNMIEISFFVLFLFRDLMVRLLSTTTLLLLALASSS